MPRERISCLLTQLQPEQAKHQSSICIPRPPPLASSKCSPTPPSLKPSPSLLPAVTVIALVQPFQMIISSQLVGHNFQCTYLPWNTVSSLFAAAPLLCLLFSRPWPYEHLACLAFPIVVSGCPSLSLILAASRVWWSAVSLSCLFGSSSAPFFRVAWTHLLRA